MSLDFSSLRTPAELDFVEKLASDYEFFARHIQRIDPKDLAETDNELRTVINALTHPSEAELLKGTIPFIFHPGQKKLDEFRVAMQKELGVVRIAVVKPRQV